MRKCKVCGEEKELTEFREYKARSINGVDTRAWECRSCKNSKEVERIKLKMSDPEYRKLFLERRSKRYASDYAKIRDKKISKYRNLKQQMVDYKGGSCSICGYNKCLGALQFHHIDPTQKEMQISLFTTFEAAKTELDKCILLCSNCHDEIHYNEGKVFSEEARERMSKAHKGRVHSKEEIEKRRESILKVSYLKRISV
jgi:5-methylcytosine-specific restriction endonuclease McrA